MPTASLEQVETRLAAVLHPTFDKPLAELGVLRDLQLGGSRLSLTLTINAASEPLKQELRARIDRALEGLGVDQVVIAWELQVPMRAAGADDPVPGVKNIVLVMSGKGGVGKSTVAVNLTLALKRAGARVGLLDADIYGPSIPTMFGVSGNPHSTDGKTIEPMQRFGVRLMSIGFMIESEKDAISHRGVAARALAPMLCRELGLAPRQ